ncbi:MAG: glycoside hydrolase family 28 protein [Bacteroidales bacterium]|nr:glycoside hydrolase family 28 protein [Bacteroidales bacterium]
MNGLTRNLCYVISVVFLLTVYGFAADAQYEQYNWNNLDDILTQINEPEFRDQTYNILEFGAESNGSDNCTDAINKAIEKCSNNGGGIVLIPEGIFYTGPIHLKDNVNLYLKEGAVLKFSTNHKDYLPLVLTRWEGVDCFNYSPLIYAYGSENVAVTGEGTLDGQASVEHWWPWKGKKAYGWVEGMDSQNIDAGRDLLMEYENKQIPLEERKMGEGHYLRPPFIQFYRCKNILIEDISIENAPFWLIHPLLSENITIRNVHVNSMGPNNDGCDPESCKNVLIENCYFNTGDDCIAIKSGRNNDGRNWNIPSENIVVRNCRMHNGHGGIVIGSEISGGCRNLYVYNCIMNSPELDRAVRIKTNAQRGGIIENIFVKDIEVGEVKEAVLKINCIYETKSEEGDFPPQIRNIHISNVKSNKSKYPVHIVGFQNKNCIYDIQIFNSKFNGVEKDAVIRGVKNFNTKEFYINGELFKWSENTD